MTLGPVTGNLASAQGAALRGLQMAGSRAADAAGRIAAFGTAPITPQREAPGTTAPEPGAPRAEPDAALLAVAADPGRAIVDLLVAQRAYEANALVLRSTDEATRTVLRRTA